MAADLDLNPSMDPVLDLFSDPFSSSSTDVSSASDVRGC